MIEFERLAKDCEFKLNKNKHKECDNMNRQGSGRKWDDCSLMWLLSRIRGETDELQESIENCNFENAILECADVANFAMFIHDIIFRYLNNESNSIMIRKSPEDT